MFFFKKSLESVTGDVYESPAEFLGKKERNSVKNSWVKPRSNFTKIYWSAEISGYTTKRVPVENSVHSPSGGIIAAIPEI